MEEDKPRIVVTGISGDLGLRLLPKLKEYRVHAANYSCSCGSCAQSR
jgi:hypothetical protein